MDDGDEASRIIMFFFGAIQPETNKDWRFIIFPKNTQDRNSCWPRNWTWTWLDLTGLTVVQRSKSLPTETHKVEDFLSKSHKILHFMIFTTKKFTRVDEEQLAVLEQSCGFAKYLLENNYFTEEIIIMQFLRDFSLICDECLWLFT